MPATNTTKLTEEVRERVAKYLQTGVTIETACAACGIAARTYRAWLKRGRAELDRLADNPRARPRKAEAIYAEFAEDVERSLAQVETRLLGNINQAASGYDTERITEVYERTEDGKVQLVDRRVQTSRERDWRAGAWLLERRWAHRYSPRQQVQQSGGVEVRVIYENEGEEGAYDDDIRC